MNISGKHKRLTDFWVAGINYRTTDTATRGKFSIDSIQYTQALCEARALGLTELFILSTCNRTEIYGFAQKPAELVSLIARQTPDAAVPFHEVAYIKNGREAVLHLFNVSAGLDSQLLGDYEIVGQVKAAVAHARRAGFIGTCLGRLVSSALQASKSIRSRTRLSNGTVSVAFAAVQYIKNSYGDLKDRNVLIIGAGEMGRSACKSLLEIISARQITVINRTAEKAIAFADAFKLEYAPIADIDRCIDAADIVLVATASPVPLVTKAQLTMPCEKLIIDLSVPNNVAPDISSLPGITLVNVDELSRIKDETLLQREAEVPLARLILDEQIADLEDWYGTHTILHVVQDKLCDLEESCAGERNPGTMTPGGQVHHIIASLAIKVKQENTIGCHCINAFNEYIGSRL